MAAAELGGRAVSTQVCLTLCFYSARRSGGPLHIPVAPFTPDTDKDPTLSGGPLSEWTNGGGHRLVVWFMEQDPKHGRY